MMKLVMRLSPSITHRRHGGPGGAAGRSRPGVLHKSQLGVKYAPGRPVYCPSLVSSSATVNRLAGRRRRSPSTSHPHPAISPRHLPITHTHGDTHPGAVSPQTPATLYPNRGGSDELPQKSYGCFGHRDFKPRPSVFMSLLFRPCRDFQQIQE